MSGRWGSQEEEEEEEVAELLRGCDAAVERCSARMVEQALSGLTPEVWSRQKLALDIKRLEQERKQEQDERELKRSRELAVIQERGGRVVEFALEGGVRLRIVMEGQEVVKDWDEQVRDMPMNDLMKRRQRRIEADRCYEGARNALEKRPPALEQAKFLFERAREAFADLGVFDMIQPLKFLERNIQRIERCEPLLAYEGLKTPVSGHDEGTLAHNGHKGRAYTDLHLAYLDEDGSRDSRDYDSIIDSLALEGGGHEEEEDEVSSIQPMVANRHPVPRHAHSDPQQRQSEGLAHLSLPYCLDLHTSVSSSSIASVSSSSIAGMGTNPLHTAAAGRRGGGSSINATQERSWGAGGLEGVSVESALSVGNGEGVIWGAVGTSSGGAEGVGCIGSVVGTSVSHTEGSNGWQRWWSADMASVVEDAALRKDVRILEEARSGVDDDSLLAVHKRSVEVALFTEMEAERREYLLRKALQGSHSPETQTNTDIHTHTHTHTHDCFARDGVMVGVAVPLEPVPLIYDKQESREIGDVGMPVALKSAAAAAAEASLSHARALGRQSAFEEHEYQDRDPDDVEDVEC